VLHRGFRIAGRSDGRHRKQMAPRRVASRRKDPFGGAVLLSAVIFIAVITPGTAPLLITLDLTVQVP